jgi:hypothetical protein
MLQVIEFYAFAAFSVLWILVAHLFHSARYIRLWNLQKIIRLPGSTTVFDSTIYIRADISRAIRGAGTVPSDVGRSVGGTSCDFYLSIAAGVQTEPLVDSARRYRRADQSISSGNDHGDLAS